MKLPEPAFKYRHEDIFGNEVGPAQPFYTSDQMRQYRIDALEEAAYFAEYRSWGDSKDLVKQLRQLKEKKHE